MSRPIAAPNENTVVVTDRFLKGVTVRESFAWHQANQLGPGAVTSLSADAHQRIARPG
jgi:hypothetical protein